MPEQSTPIASIPMRHQLPKWWPIGLGVLLIIAAFVTAWLADRQQRPIADVQLSPEIAVTPTDFSSFIGRIKSIDSQVLTVNFNLTSQTGAVIPITYLVTVSPTTILHAKQITNGAESLTAALLADFKTGDAVLVASDLNLYNQYNFTATTIIKLIS